MTDERTTVTLGRLRTACRLLMDSIESYEKHGTRATDKVDNDLRTIIRDMGDLRVEIARRG